MNGIMSLLLENLRTPHTDTAAVFVSQAILVFGVLACVFIAAHSKRRRLWWSGAFAHVAGGALLPLTSNLAGFFLAWELVTIGASLILVSEPDGRTLLKRYLPWQLLAAALLLSSFAIQYAQTSSVHIPYDGFSAGLIPLGFALAIKTASMPFHVWLVRTYSSVRPATTVLLSAVVTKIGLFGVYRLLPGHVVLEVAGGLLALTGVLYTLRQRQVRTFLAYYMVSQIGYMIAGLGNTNALARQGGVFQLGSSVVYTGLLFMVAAGSIRKITSDTADFSRGTHRHSPVLIFAALASALSITAAAPFSGYVGKTLLQQNLQTDIAAVLFSIASIGTAIALTRFMWHGFLKPGSLRDTGFLPEQTDIPFRSDHELLRTGIVPGTVRTVVLIVLAALCLLMGIFPTSFFPVLPEGTTALDVRSVTSGQITPLVGVIFFAVAYRPMLRILRVALPGSGAVTAWANRRIIRMLKAIQRQHSGDIRRYLGWALAGSLALWVWVLIFAQAP